MLRSGLCDSVEGQVRIEYYVNMYGSQCFCKVNLFANSTLQTFVLCNDLSTLQFKLVYITRLSSQNKNC